MRERAIFLYIVSLAGAVLSFTLSRGALLVWSGEDISAIDVLGSTGVAGAPWTKIPFIAAESLDMVQMVAASLAVVVLASVVLLLNLVRKFVIGRIFAVCALIITMWAVGPALLPMTAATMLSLNSQAKYRPAITCAQTVCVCTVCLFVFWPGVMVVITTVLMMGFSLYVLRLMERLVIVEQIVESSTGRVEEMREMLGNQRRMVRSLDHVSRLEERNRLATRIHDEIGHGMSGSILLLEGADLVMDKEPEKARETIRKVTENLRASVEEIRRVLREERSDGAEVSLARIENELTAFEADHPQIKTRLDIDGDMSGINSMVWICIYENLVEALTNALKHSSATVFLVSLKKSGGLLRVEFADNGGLRKQGMISQAHEENTTNNSRYRMIEHLQIDKSHMYQGEIKPGIGMQSMEERTAICHGRCFFRHEPDGFHIVMTFPRGGKV